MLSVRTPRKNRCEVGHAETRGRKEVDGDTNPLKNKEYLKIVNCNSILPDFLNPVRGSS